MSLIEKMFEFQTKCPSILPTSDAKILTKNGKEYTYKYADYFEIMEKIRPLLSELKILIKFKIDENKLILSINDVESKEVFTSTILIDKFLIEQIASPQKSAQDFGAILTFLKRYMLVTELNIVSEKNENSGLKIKKEKRESMPELLEHQYISAIEIGTANQLLNVIAKYSLTKEQKLGIEKRINELTTVTK